MDNPVMLHLPGPQLCPVCNLVHTDPPPSAADLRPIYGTYPTWRFPAALWNGSWGGTINENNDNWWDTVSVTLPYSGYYIAIGSAIGGEFSPGWQLECDLRVGGNQYFENYGTGARPGHPQFDSSFVRVYMRATFYNVGTVAYCRFHNSDNPAGCEMYLAFVPTPANPR